MLAAVADRELLPGCADYWLNTGQVMAVGPDEPAQYLHRDENNWPEAVNPDRELTISCMFALSDFTRENGATVVVTGSQAYPPGLVRGHDVTDAEVAYSEMSAGSGMIYSGKVIHGAGANTTDGWRYGMHVSFVVGWLRPEVSVVVSTGWMSPFDTSSIMSFRDDTTASPTRYRSRSSVGQAEDPGWLTAYPANA
jgi:ectoine hydroxylase-related dioxygenase (phytanoyl-CoA dioxygenase family)